MKEFYGVLKDQLFKNRHDYDTYYLQETLDICQEHLNITLKALIKI